MSILFLLSCAALAACGSNTPGRTEWIKPRTTASRVGIAIMIRGWQGVFSPGIDEMARQINDQGGTALVYMPEQYPEIATALVQAFKDAPVREPICFVGHSRGVDSSLIIARELDKVHIPVDVICCLDSVDEVTVPGNVRVCYNYWMPGVGGRNTDILRGIPLVQVPGATGKLYNYDLSGEYSSWRGPMTEHIGMSNDALIQKRIINQILEVCVERSKWMPPTGRS
jgi:hypothetical protein